MPLDAAGLFIRSRTWDARFGVGDARLRRGFSNSAARFRRKRFHRNPSRPWKKPRGWFAIITSTIARHPMESCIGTMALPAWRRWEIGKIAPPIRSTITSRSIPRLRCVAACKGCCDCRYGATLVQMPAQAYTQAGLTIARTLLAEPYLSVDSQHEGLLLHSIYHRPNNWDYIPAGPEDSVRGVEHVGGLPFAGAGGLSATPNRARGRHLTFFSYHNASSPCVRVLAHFDRSRNQQSPERNF